jgi:hypothetical protein
VAGFPIIAVEQQIRRSWEGNQGQAAPMVKSPLQNAPQHGFLPYAEDAILRKGKIGSKATHQKRPSGFTRSPGKAVPSIGLLASASFGHGFRHQLLHTPARLLPHDLR